MAKVEKRLLLHWWDYYGKEICTLSERDEFENIIDEYGVEKVLDAALASYIHNDGSPTVMLMCIRTEFIDKLFESLPDTSKMNKEEKEEYEKAKNAFLKMLENTIE